MQGSVVLVVHGSDVSSEGHQQTGRVETTELL